MDGGLTVARRSKIYVGNSAANATVLGADSLVERAIRHGTKAIREPMEAAMREVYSGVKRDWPQPRSSNRGGNRRARGEGFNPEGWTSSGYSLKRWRWSTNVGIKKGIGALAVALTNDSTKRGQRYAFMARQPYPNKKFYWRMYALRPMRAKGKILIKQLAANMRAALAGR